MSPLGEEIYIAAMAFLTTSVFLYLLSKLQNFETQDLKTPVKISLVLGVVSFSIRSTALVFNIAYPQRMFINVAGMLIENLLLIMMIKKLYSLGWRVTLVTWGSAFFGRHAITGVVSAVIVFTMFPEFVEKRGEILEKLFSR